jgi:hypothetical protein
LFNAFTEHEKAFNEWVMDGFPGVKDATRKEYYGKTRKEEYFV